MKKYSPENQSSSNQIPFLLGEKIGEGSHAEVFRSAKDPHKLVKKLKIRETFSIFEENDGERVVKNYNETGFREHYQTALRLLQKHLGKFLPETQLVFGTDESGKTCGYLITEEVVPDQRNNSAQTNNDLDEMLASIIEMHKNQPAGIKFIPDITGEDEFRYGHTQKNPISKYYILDIYPTFKINDDELKKHISYVLKESGITYFPKTNKALEGL